MKIRRAAKLVLVLLVIIAGLELTLRLAGSVILALKTGSAQTPDPGVFRILHLGESTTYGLEVPSEQTYVAQLESLLKESRPERPVQSFNRGVPGIVTTSMLQTLPDKLSSLRPDLVIIMAGANDFNEELNGLQPPGASQLPAWVRGIRLYKVVRLALDMLRKDVKVEHGEVIYFKYGGSKAILYDTPRDEEKISQVTARFEDNLGLMIELCRQAGARVILVGYLQAFQENEMLRRTAQRWGIPYADCFIYPQRRSPSLFTADGWHPSASGHRHIAQTLLPLVAPLL